MDHRYEIPTTVQPNPWVRYALDHICAVAHTVVAWNILATAEFTDWSRSLSQRELAALNADLNVLGLIGPRLGRPYVDTVSGSRHANMKELRTGMLRSFFVFDPHRTAVFLIGGDKRRDKRFYGRMIALADKLYDAYLDGKRMEDRD